MFYPLLEYFQENRDFNITLAIRRFCHDLKRNSEQKFFDGCFPEYRAQTQPETAHQTLEPSFLSVHFALCFHLLRSGIPSWLGRQTGLLGSSVCHNAEFGTPCFYCASARLILDPTLKPVSGKDGNGSVRVSTPGRDSEWVRMDTIARPRNFMKRCFISTVSTLAVVLLIGKLRQKR